MREIDPMPWMERRAWMGEQYELCRAGLEKDDWGFVKVFSQRTMRVWYKAKGSFHFLLLL